MEWINDDEQRGGQGIVSEAWIRTVLIAGLVIGLGILVVKWWRRSGGESVPLMGSVLALVGTRAMASSEGSLDSSRVRVALTHLAKTCELLTPTELFEALKEAGLQWDSPSHMGVQLAQMGIRSQVRTIEGRTARRWYDLSGYTGSAEGTEA